MSPIVWVGLFVTVAAFLVAGVTGWRTARYVGRHRAPSRPLIRPQRAMWREWLPDRSAVKAANRVSFEAIFAPPRRPEPPKPELIDGDPLARDRDDDYGDEPLDDIIRNNWRG